MQFDALNRLLNFILSFKHTQDTQAHVIRDEEKTKYWVQFALTIHDANILVMSAKEKKVMLNKRVIYVTMRW